MEYDAVVFDMDGVLVERTPGWVFDEAAETALAAAGVEEPTEYEFHAVRTLDTTVEAATDHFETEHGVTFADLWTHRDRLVTTGQRTAVARGEKTTYEDTHRVTELPAATAVVSNNLQAAVEHVLGAFDLADRFDALYGLDPHLSDHENRKPDPTYLRRALAAVDADDAVYVGDRPSDVRAAHRAGVDSAFVRRPFAEDTTFEDVEPTYDVASLGAFEAAIRGS
ncbi:HAD family hydrolase [Halobaculum sp. MBLA0143]|uniref:HAD family hydrolase n=1 Tax=Halobaculum sp. MBLA0143 TaxID=3079933 RepID=UPI003524A7B2